jgi:hypothetical protein
MATTASGSDARRREWLGTLEAMEDPRVEAAAAAEEGMSAFEDPAAEVIDVAAVATKEDRESDTDTDAIV